MGKNLSEPIKKDKLIRTTICLPESLLVRLRERRDVNWSRVCKDALSSALGDPAGGVWDRLLAMEKELAELKSVIIGAKKALAGE